MNYPLPKKLSPLTAANPRLERSLLTKMNALQERLDNFTVLDQHGTPVGDVRNLVLHQRQLSFVIVQPDIHKYWRFVLLGCHLVDRISLRDRVVHVRATQADMSYLPEHGAPQATMPHAGSTHHVNEVNHISRANEHPNVIAPVRQTLIPLRIDHDQRQLARKTASGWLTAPKGVLQSPLNVKESSLLDAPAKPKVLAATVNITEPQSLHVGNHASANGSNSFSSSGEPDASRNAHVHKTSSETFSQGTIALEPSLTNVATVVSSAQAPTMKGEFTSPKHATQFLDAIARTLAHRCKAIRLEIELEDPALQGVFQEWLNQYMAMSKK